MLARTEWGSKTRIDTHNAALKQNSKRQSAPRVITAMRLEHALIHCGEEYQGSFYDVCPDDTGHVCWFVKSKVCWLLANQENRNTKCNNNWKHRSAETVWLLFVKVLRWLDILCAAVTLTDQNLIIYTVWDSDLFHIHWIGIITRNA